MEKEMTTETEVMQGTLVEAIEGVVQSVQEEIKPYTLRPLKSKDLFPMMKIISCIKISKFSDCFSPDATKRLIEKSKQNQNITMEDVEEIGMGVALEIGDVILANLPNAEKYIYQLLSNLSGMTVKELEDMNPGMFFAMIMDVVRQSGFADFFKVALKSIG
jgi:hypothetical protein